MLKQAHNPYILACHLQIDTELRMIPDPAYHYDADPDTDFYLILRLFLVLLFKLVLANSSLDVVLDPDADPYFYFMRMQIRKRIQVTKMMRIRTDNSVIKSMLSMRFKAFGACWSYG